MIFSRRISSFPFSHQGIEAIGLCPPETNPMVQCALALDPHRTQVSLRRSPEQRPCRVEVSSPSGRDECAGISSIRYNVANLVASESECNARGQYQRGVMVTLSLSNYVISLGHEPMLAPSSPIAPVSKLGEPLSIADL